MKKQTITIMIILFSVVLVSATIIGNIIDANFTSLSKPEQVRYSGNITFLADGKQGYCELDEPNLDIDDDFEECLAKNYPNMRITNAKDWTGRDYKQVVIDDVIYRSFDEDKLNDLINQTSP